MTPSKTTFCAYFMISFYGKAQGLITYAFSSLHWPFGVQHVWKSFLRPFSLFNSTKSLRKKKTAIQRVSRQCMSLGSSKTFCHRTWFLSSCKQTRLLWRLSFFNHTRPLEIPSALSGKIPSATGYRWKQQAINKHVTLQSLLFPFQPSRSLQMYVELGWVWWFWL